MIAAINHYLNIFVTGKTKADIVNQVFTWELKGETRILSFHSKGYARRETISYGKIDPSDKNQFNESEAYKAAERYLFDQLKNYGWDLYYKEKF